MTLPMQKVENPPGERAVAQWRWETYVRFVSNEAIAAERARRIERALKHGAT